MVDGDANYVELRVHGVSGTPPQDMLDSLLVRQVAGDQEGRFFRPVNADGSEVRAADGHVVEGYQWGPLTSGSWRQALWLVLIPFGLVNAAYFMLPAPVDEVGRWARLVARGALRALGIVLTAILVLSVAQAVVDLLAWQWTGLAPDGRRGADPRLWVCGAFVVAALSVVAIRLLSGPPHALPDEGRWEPDDDVQRLTGLAAGEFYTGDRDVPALHRLHAVAGISVVAVLAAAVARTYVDGAWLDGLYWTTVALLVLAVVQAAVLGDPRAERRRVPAFVAGPLPTVELGIAVGVLAVSVFTVSRSRNLPAADRGVLPGVGDLGLWVSAAALLALVALAGAAAVLARRTPERGVPRPFRRFLKGMVSPVVAALGLFLGVGFTAALDYGVLRLLRPADQPQAMDLPLFHLRIAHAAGVAVVLGVAGLLVLVVVKRFAARAFETKVRAASNLPPAGPDPDGSGWLAVAQVRPVAGAWWLARLKYHVQWPVLAVASVGTILTIAAVVEAVEDLVVAGGHAANLTQCRPDSVLPAWLDWLSDCRDLPGPDLVTIGTVALLGVGLGLAYLGRSALGNSAIRRSAAVVWDLVAFWPRAAHPLVPPPYAPKVIEDLRRRIAWHLGECAELAPGRVCTCHKSPTPVPYVVLAGHSQGSLIAVAALTRLSAAYRRHVALLTFGAQLQIAYPRAFPAYVNHAHLCWLWRVVLRGRWRSLYRESDPIGGPVLSWDRSDDKRDRGCFTSRRLDQSTPDPQHDEIDPDTGLRECGPEWRLLDPVPADGQGSPHWGLRRHSSYSLDPAWPRALAKLVAGRYGPRARSGRSED
jgi:hypothetical protein